MSELPHGDAAQARWRRVHNLFDEAADLDPDSQQALLDQVCRDDPALRREVGILLAHDRSSSDAIEQVLAAAAGDVSAASVEWTSPLPSTIGHYRILERLGEGGMGEVFLAEDVTLGRHVALKLPPPLLASDPAARAQLLREARAAAALNHPHACVVHEVGTAPDGRPFIAMEYLEGETLASRIARGPLPADEVIRLGIEAAGALIEAHARGVVHRDIKPSNIVLTPHGSKLLDFGLARVSHDPGAVGVEGCLGTLRYMSPEQTRGDEVDHRTDVFSLGVVLYEAATGQRPFDGVSPRAAREATLHHDPAPPSAVVSSLPTLFDRIVWRALAKAPEDRYQQASELLADLTRLDSGLRRRWHVAAAALVTTSLAAAALLLAGVFDRGRTPAPVSEPPTVLVAAFANSTDDPAFEWTLRRALVLQLQETPFLRVFPDAGTRETLRLMAHAPDTPLTPALAREVARRRGVDAVVSGSIALAGSHYVVSLEAVNGVSGDVMARAQAEAQHRDDVLPALGRTIVQLREGLGESVATLQRFRTPVEQATTTSMDALRAYALGLEQASQGEYALAMSLYQRAVEIDPDFALAHQALAGEALNSGNLARVAPAATRAYELRERVSEHEQFRIVIFFHFSVTGDLDRAVEAAEEWQRIYPHDWRSYHTLGNLYLATWDHARAASAAGEAVRLNPDVAAAYSNRGGALFALGRFDQAREVYQAAMARGFDAPEYHAYLWRIAYHAGDTDAMQHHLDWAASSASWARNMPALTATLQGRWRTALDASARATSYFDARGMTGLSAMAGRYNAVAGALLGDCPVARRETARSLPMSVLPEERARMILALALCGDLEQVHDLREDLAGTHPGNTNLQRVWLPLIDAARLLAAGDGNHAAEVLGAMRTYDASAESMVVYLRALALLEMGALHSARADFESVIIHKGRALWVPVVPLAHLGLARAAARAGDLDGASRAYAALFSLWQDADPDLPILVAARRESAGLSPPE